MESPEWSEIVEIDPERFISLEFSRQWPKYVVMWWVRQRVGESDFPLAEGSADRLPSQSGESVEQMWDELRQRAVEQATAAAASASPPGVDKTEHRSLLDRLLRRG